MSATQQTSLPQDPGPTPADHDAMLASVMWFREQRAAGMFECYAGMHVAVLGEAVIDADREEHELLQRLRALGAALPPNRVVIQYVPGPDDRSW